ncbi:dihydroxyacetone kinase subunit DhaL [Reinekea marinisedimentorum]|uniref:Dihydroxyacetone kinase-like protein n=1 Tax=Reinekea marinisedimentorum TaxID=230495 RepID=A0A4R3I7J0_9GAMM|nr:dihydroxyacetone kinase subunit DhaL [Reinekea marinisedimentorum]TCS41147.1 dihydroxyacetone kinase-like protein [Reinekea marinisedimentorum]
MNTLNHSKLNGMFLAASASIQQQVPYLNELDGKTGDGDHGTTMHRVCQSIDSSLTNSERPVGQQLDDLGWDIMSQDGGSAGMLIGKFLMGIGAGIAAEEVNTEQLAAAFRSGLDQMVASSGAKPGDKTMLDALIPAIEALEQQARQGASIEQMFEQAVKAADEGFQATKAMVPARGRAKNMGERAVGYLDPGAASMSIMFESFNQYIAAA